MLTPKLLAILTTDGVVVRWARSVNAVFEDCARAFCTFVSERRSPFGPTGVPMLSPPSFWILSSSTLAQPVDRPGSSYTAAEIAWEYWVLSWSGGTQRYVL